MGSERWRTSTVQDLLQIIRTTKDWSLFPILADALDDAEYEDVDLLVDHLRSNEKRTEVQAERVIALLWSEETKQAVLEIDRIAEAIGGVSGYGDKSIPMSYELLMEAAIEGGYTQDGYTGWQDEFPPYADKFWECYVLINGTPILDIYDRQFLFSCSC